MTYNYPKTITKLEGNTLDVDLGNKTTLTILSESNPPILFCFMRQSTKVDGTNIGVVKTSAAVVKYISTSESNADENPPFTCSYVKRKWVYFGIDNTLVLYDGMFMYAEIKVCEDQIFATCISSNKYSSLCQMARKQNKEKPSVPVVIPSVIPDLKSDLGLLEILNDTASSDFTIVCNDNETIPVHSLILSKFWPFFKNMLTNDCIEKTEKTLKLEFPSTWVKQLINHLYKQPLDLTLDTATGLLVISHMYLLPGLGEEVSKQIEALVTTETALEDLLQGWERANQAENDSQKMFFAKKIAKHGSLDDAMKDWDEVKLLSLYLDTVKLV